MMMRLEKRIRCLVAVTALVLFTPAVALADLPLAQVAVPEGTVVPSEPIVPTIERLSWSAILAGVVVFMAAYLAFSTLGIGIGAAAIDPSNRDNPVKGVPTTLLVWMFISGLAALFVGGWVSGRLAGTVPFDSAVHGVIMWAFATVVMAMLATTSLGYILGGTFRLLCDGTSAAVQTTAAILPEASRMAKDVIVEHVPQIDWKPIEREAKQLLHETGKDELQPEEVSQKAGELKEHGQKARNRAAQNPQQADEEVHDLLNKAYGMARETLSAADRDALMNVVSSRTGMSKDETRKTLDKWERMYQDAKQKYQQMAAQAEQSAREAADATKTAISRAAIWTFASLVLGVIVAAMGGNLGSTFFRV